MCATVQKFNYKKCSMKIVKIKDCILIHANCFEAFETLKYVDAVITDPPYNYDNINFDWDESKIDSQIEISANNNAKVKHITPNSRLGGQRNKKWYDSVAAKNHSFFVDCCNLNKAIQPLLKSGGYYLQFCDHKSTDLVGRAHRKYFFLKDYIVWMRNSGIIRGRPASRDGIDLPNHNTVTMQMWESITVSQAYYDDTTPKNYAKNGLGYIATKYKNKFVTNIIQCRRSRAENYDHISVKPLALMQQLVYCYCPPNKIVLDPFMGTGTTGVACHLEGRKFVGIERDAKNFEIACDRINDITKLRPLF